MRAVVLSVLFLAACSPAEISLYSPRPLFAEGDPEVVLRPGVWLLSDPTCEVDTQAPVSTWPECVHWEAVADGAFSHPERADRAPYLITPGGPRVLQIRQSQDIYGLEVVRGLEFDGERYVIALHRSALACDDIVAPEPDPRTPEQVEDALVEHAQDCLRTAMIDASLADEPPGPNFSWVRASAD